MNCGFKIGAIALTSLMIVSCTESVTPTLDIEGGKVVGVETENSVVYKGIPYAAAPVGDLRWKKPHPVVAWEGVKVADTFGCAAIQAKHDPNDGVYGTEFFAEDSEMSEDCLYLNIWTPKGASDHPEKKLPVAIWIHGGAFTGGWGHEIEFDGEAWTKRDVVLVTINYRLGIYGFLCHPLLSEEDENGISGNYGLYDQAKAIQWVHDNIAQFGGDPDNIALFGQSAGAMSVKYQVSSPVSKGLISKAIIMSGGGLGQRGLNDGNNQALIDAPGQDMMNMAGLYTLEAMRSATVEQLDSIVAAYQNTMHRQFSTRPHYDDVFAPLSFDDATYENAIADIPYMIGGLADDFGGLNKGCEEFASLRDSLSTQPTYVYYFDAPAPDPEDRSKLKGSFHSAELCYVFHTQDRIWRPYSEADYALSDKIVDYWTNFVKYGNPNGKADGEWKPSTRQNPYTHVLKRDE